MAIHHGGNSGGASALFDSSPRYFMLARREDSHHDPHHPLHQTSRPSYASSNTSSWWSQRNTIVIVAHATHRFYTTIHTSLLTVLTLIAGSGLIASVIAEETVSPATDWCAYPGAGSRHRRSVRPRPLPLPVMESAPRSLSPVSAPRSSASSTASSGICPIRPLMMNGKSSQSAKRHRDLTSLEKAVAPMIAAIALSCVCCRPPLSSLCCPSESRALA